ncbi:hypothetical protein AB1I63_06290 [Streptococcus pneumoniae]
MKRECNKKSALLTIPILCINFGINLHRLQFDHLTLAKMITDGIVLLHPVLIGIISIAGGKIEIKHKKVGNSQLFCLESVFISF